MLIIFYVSGMILDCNLNIRRNVYYDFTEDHNHLNIFM